MKSTSRIETPGINQANPSRTVNRRSHRLYGILIGLTALTILLQALWAGIFLQHDGARDAASTWITVHARGGEVALALAAAAAVAAFVRHRRERELWLGGAILVALLVFESYIGGLIKDDGRDSLTVLHVPAAMAIMALVVWLPLRARAHSRAELSADSRR